MAPYARTEKHIRELSEAGIDLVVGIENDRQTLDLLQAYGISAIVSHAVPEWWGGYGDKAGTMEKQNPLARYDDAAKSFEDHPAICGIHVGDEPSAADFPHYGQVIRRVEQVFEQQFAFLNLYPNYGVDCENSPEAVLRQLGTSTYEEYIKQYCQYVDTDYLCLDHYPCCHVTSAFYENLRIASDACLRTGRDLWMVLQVNSPDPTRWITENELRFQAYSALAFGARSILWACYTAGWWYHQVLDEEGNPTEQYGKLKRVNRELRAVTEVLMRFRRVSTHFVGFTEREMLGVNQKPSAILSTASFCDVREEGGAPLLVGRMQSCRDGSAEALLLFVADASSEPSAREYHVVFRVAADKRVFVIGGQGDLSLERRSDGSCAVTVAACEGILLVTAS